MLRISNRVIPASQMRSAIGRRLRAAHGATSAEYALLIALIALAIMVGAGTLGGELSRSYDAGGNHIDSGMVRNMPGSN